MSDTEKLTDSGPTLLWLRRDLRLEDHPALQAAIDAGAPVIPVYIFDEVDGSQLGAAPRWRLSQSLRKLEASIAQLGGRLVLRRGGALATLRALIAETGARRVFWSRLYGADSIKRDSAVKAALSEMGIEVRSFEGFLLREPFRTAPKTGPFYKVYTPFMKALRAELSVASPILAPSRWPALDGPPPASETIDALGLESAMARGAPIVARYAQVGEAAAAARLDVFLETGLGAYHARRDRLDLRDATSRLGQNLAFGEISPRRVWRAAEARVAADGGARDGAKTFLDEIIWREFAWHLAHHTPRLRNGNWRSEWDAFPWRGEAEAGGEIDAWRRGRTGVPVIDAAMRELYVTGTMHNRARMLVGSYLTKNLLVDWRVGERWFADHLIDFDPASNAMGWQWVAGSGPDAAPFFRIFNPETQAEKFDPQGAYVARWLPEAAPAQPTFGAAAETAALDVAEGRFFFDACPLSWALSPEDPYPKPMLSLKHGRERALAAYQTLRAG